MKTKKDQRITLIRLHAERCRKSKFVARPDLPARQKMLRGIDLSDESLSQLVVYDADMSQADFSRAKLSEAELLGCDLRQANFTSADLTECNFSGSDLSGSDFTDARITLARFEDCALNDLKGIIMFPKHEQYASIKERLIVQAEADKRLRIKKDFFSL